MKIEPDIVTKLEEMKAILGEGYRSYTFTINDDADGTNYTHTASDEAGNSVTMNERKVKDKAAIAAQAAARVPRSPK